MHDFPPPPRLAAISARAARFKNPAARSSELALGRMQLLASAVFWFLGSAVAQTPPPAENAVSPERAQLTRRLPKELGLELAASCFRSGQDRACTLEGDFDGDKRRDLAVLVQAKGCASRGPAFCKRVGIAFLLGNGKCEVLGAGHGRWRQVDENTGRVGAARALTAADFAADSARSWSWRVWRLTAEGPRPLTGNGPHPTAVPPGMRGDGVELSGGDASILVYRASSGWINYALGY